LKNITAGGDRQWNLKRHAEGLKGKSLCCCFYGNAVNYCPAFATTTFPSQSNALQVKYRLRIVHSSDTREKKVGVQ
jgi:hypothetical protein